MKHEIINRIIEETGSKSFLEIGYGNGHNFDKIKCDIKLATDPTLKGSVFDDKKQEYLYNKESDDFWDEKELDDIDVIFIDGLHHADQVRKDIINAMKCNPKAIILHDTMPHSKAMQEVPRTTKEWTGDCWKAAVGFHQSYPDVRFETYRSDYGLSVFYPEGKKVKKHFEKIDLTYEEFKENEVELLCVID